MKPSSQSSEPKSRRRWRRQAKTDFALRATMSALYGVGLAVNNAQEADEAIDLAAKMMSIALGWKVKPSEVRKRMAELMEEWMMETSTKH